MTVHRIRTLLAALLLVALASANAAAPFAKAAPPGWYRMMLGDFEITALSDGTLPLEAGKILTNTTPDRVEAALARSFLADPVATSVNGFLVNTGEKLVLIDTGAGSFFGPTLGKLVDNLKASGYQPEQVDEIYITHMHGDHIGGLVAGGKPAFANAIVRADRHDADEWLSEAKRAAAKGNDNAYKGAMTALGPYVSAGRFEPFEGNAELVRGVRAHATHGHTPGHTNYVVESGGRKLVLWGDLMHVAAVQFPEPAVTITFDSDSNAAMAQRQKTFAEVAKDGSLVGGAHIAFPGLGHLRREGNGYAWVPVNYAPAR